MIYLKDILNYVPKGVNPEAKLIRANGCKWNSEMYIVKSSRKAVLLNTDKGQIWLPLSAIRFTHSGGKQYFLDGKCFYEWYTIEKDDELLLKVRTNFDYIEIFGESK